MSERSAVVLLRLAFPATFTGKATSLRRNSSLVSHHKTSTETVYTHLNTDSGSLGHNCCNHSCSKKCAEFKCNKEAINTVHVDNVAQRYYQVHHYKWQRILKNRRTNHSLQ